MTTDSSALKKGITRAFPFFFESQKCSNLLFCRNSRRKTAAHFCWNCSRNGEGFEGTGRNIPGQHYFAKAIGEITFETNSDPCQFVSGHIHPVQNEFILEQEGQLEHFHFSLNRRNALTCCFGAIPDGEWFSAKANDSVRMARHISHGYFTRSDKPARALFRASPAAGRPKNLFANLHSLANTREVVRFSVAHKVDCLPPLANN